MDYRQYISILDSASGTYQFNLETFNALTNINVTFSLSILNSDDEIQAARKVELAIVSALTANTFAFEGTTATLSYNGFPGLSSDVPLPVFQVTRTEHVVCLWSQSQFRLTVTNTTAGIIEVSNGPILARLPVLDEVAELYGVDLSSYTSRQKMILSRNISSKLTNGLHNNLVISTYLHQGIGTRSKAILVKQGPVVSYNAPRTGGAISLSSRVLYTQNVREYSCVSKAKIINYLAASYLVNRGEPFKAGAELIVTYKAGEFFIPDIIIEKCIVLIGMLLNDDEGGVIKALQGGTGSIEYSDKTNKNFEYILAELWSFNNA